MKTNPISATLGLALVSVEFLVSPATAATPVSGIAEKDRQPTYIEHPKAVSIHFHFFTNTSGEVENVLDFQSASNVWGIHPIHFSVVKS